MNKSNPKIIGIYKELNLIGNEIHLKLKDEKEEGDAEVHIVVKPDPSVTETITCTECVCSHAEIDFKDKVKLFEVSFVLPEEARFANNTNVKN